MDKNRRRCLLAEREQMIEEYASVRDEFRALCDAPDSPPGRQRELQNRMSDLASRLGANREQYDETIPRLKISECPFDREPLVMAFDPVSLDGLWWMEFTRRTYSRERKPPAFRLLRGAVSLQEAPPGGGRHQALIGPGVPYVIPRILELPSMMMVISQIRLDSGHIAYILAYFSSRDPGPGRVTSGWLEKNLYHFVDDHGRAGWSLACDSWDFNITQWVRKGKIRWIPPGGDTLAPESANPSDCPFCELEGVRLPQIVEGDHVFTEPLPDPAMGRNLFD